MFQVTNIKCRLSLVKEGYAKAIQFFLKLFNHTSAKLYKKSTSDETTLKKFLKKWVSFLFLLCEFIFSNALPLQNFYELNIFGWL